MGIFCPTSKEKVPEETTSNSKKSSSHHLVKQSSGLAFQVQESNFIKENVGKKIT